MTDPGRIVQPDPDSLQRRAADPGASVWVGASAGSGKTKVLTDRVLTLMLEGTPPQRILCLTFTKAAAAEMANRINKRLAEWATDDDAALADALVRLTGRRPEPERMARARRLFAQVLDAPGGMNIQTIHGFCESLLARFPLEAGIPPHFEVLDERSAAELMQVARDTVLAAAETDATLAAALASITRHAQEDGFASLMVRLSAERGRLARAVERHGGVEGAVSAVLRRLGVEPDETEDTPILAACDDLAFDALGLRRIAMALLDGKGKTDPVRGEKMARWLAGSPADRRAGFEDYAGVFLTQKLEIRSTLLPKAIREDDPGLADVMAVEAARLEAAYARCRIIVTAAASTGLLRLGAALLGIYEAAKRARALLDYDDLIYAAKRLLEAPGVAPWVLFKLDGGLDHILIDEAQDTNPEQWDIVRALAEEFFTGEGARDTTRTVFAVGDRKQSIFSFQRADPEAFQRMQAHFESRVGAAGQEWRNVELDISFRSADAVLRAVDATFAAGPARDGVIDAGAALRHIAFRQGQAGRVELWPLVGPRMNADPEPWAPPLERVPGDSPANRLAAVIAARIKAWIGHEMLPARGRPIRAGDIMILVRRRRGIMEAVVRALKLAGVPVAGVDRMVLTDQLAVMDLVALGRFLLLPEDDLTLATVLKGPFLGFDDDDLFRLAHDRKGTALWRRLAHDEAARPAHDWLAALLARADFVRPYELFAQILAMPVPAGGTGRERMIARLGVEAEDPIDEFLSLALAYERGRVPSLQGFLHWAEAGAVEIKRDLEQGARDEVRVMTAHGAKGLQAPVVILPDTVQMPAQQGPELRWVDGLPLWTPSRRHEEEQGAAARDDVARRRLEEHRRLLYVAMTRAEDRLHICGWHGRSEPAEGCWYALIRDGLSGIAAETEFDFTLDSADGWRGDGLVLDLPQQAALQKPEESAPDEHPLLPVQHWMRRPPPPEPTPSRPLMPSRPSAEAPPVVSPLAGGGTARFRRGLLIHRLLQGLPDLPAESRDAACRRLLARPLHDLAPPEQEALRREVMAVLEHPALMPLFGPDSRAEVPLAGLIPLRDGAPEAVSGQVDRLVVTPEAILVLDYKTLRPPPSDPADVPPAYLRQMALYRAILRRIWPDRRIDCHLLWTDGPLLMPLSAQLLDRHIPGS
ncbi:MAG: double-strand break repair helicase AddA [Alphaproteobacteria bacterium]